MKVGLAFFGITRSLKYAIKSIKENILDQLKISDITWDIFMHTYTLDNYINKRTGEKNENVDNEEFKLLNPDFLHVDNQDMIKEKINMLLYRSQPDPWNTEYNSVDNFILAQYSKSILVEMIEKSNNIYDYIIFLRPDCFYFEKFNIDFFRHVNDTTICIPNFHLFGKYAFNDRFCISNMKTYKLYGNIFKDLLDISKTQPLHSETVIGELMDLFKLSIIRIPFKFSRIRCNGIDQDRFKKLPKNQ
jgi:hypothetical protein